MKRKRMQKRRIFTSLTEDVVIMGVPKLPFIIATGTFLPLALFFKNVFFFVLLVLVLSYFKILSRSDSRNIELLYKNFMQEKELDA